MYYCTCLVLSFGVQFVPSLQIYFQRVLVGGVLTVSSEV